MNNDTESEFQNLFEQYKSVRTRLHRKLSQLETRAKQIEKRYTPRNIFNTWRDSQDGKEWKKQQYEKQQHKCSNPDCSFVAISIEYLEIDHIKPIATHPHLAIEPNNLRLLCPPCNKAKSSKQITTD